MLDCQKQLQIKESSEFYTGFKLYCPVCNRSTELPGDVARPKTVADVKPYMDELCDGCGFAVVED